MIPDKPTKTNVNEERVYRTRILGTGAATPSKVVGNGVTVTRTGVGVFRYTFADNPGQYVDFIPTLQAETPSDVKGHTIIADTYVPPASGELGYIELSLFNASDAAHDLAAAEYLGASFIFSASSLALT